jgi:hypothetical protein
MVIAVLTITCAREYDCLHRNGTPTQRLRFCAGRLIHYSLAEITLRKAVTAEVF